MINVNDAFLKSWTKTIDTSFLSVLNISKKGSGKWLEQIMNFKVRDKREIKAKQGLKWLMHTIWGLK